MTWRREPAPPPPPPAPSAVLLHTVALLLEVDGADTVPLADLAPVLGMRPGEVAHLVARGVRAGYLTSGPGAGEVGLTAKGWAWTTWAAREGSE